MLLRLKKRESTKDVDIVEFVKFVFTQLALEENKEKAKKWIRCAFCSLCFAHQ